MLQVVQFPKGIVPAGTFSTTDQVTADAEGKHFALRTITPNEPILASNISGRGDKLGLSSVVTEGMRAVSFKSNEAVGVSGFVLPGDRVDVLLTRGDKSQVLADNVRVLGVDQISGNQADKPVVAKSITVEVTPDQAQAITLGQAVGIISLTLRRVADNSPLRHQEISVNDLAGAPVVRAARGGPSFRVYRGVQGSQVSAGVAKEPAP
jgi:pilus assembly protein CpaB